MKARDLLGENESAIVLFTDGQELHIREDRTGSTSNWKLSRKHDYDKVIVYRRDIETGTNEVPWRFRETSRRVQYPGGQSLAWRTSSVRG